MQYDDRYDISLDFIDVTIHLCKKCGRLVIRGQQYNFAAMVNIVEVERTADKLFM